MDFVKVTGFQIFRYSLPFKKPYSFKGRILELRDGALLKLTTDAGIHGFGEAAPLPGVSAENVDDAIRDLQGLKPVLLDGVLPESWGRFTLCPSVRFAVEAAVLNLFSNTANATPARMLESSSPSRVDVNALLEGPLTELIEQTVDLINQGFTVFKLKVGSGNLMQDVEKVQALSDILHNQGVLRLDANQSWSYEQALAFVQKIPIGEIEYFEEPFAETARIPEFFKHTQIPVALDESLWKKPELEFPKVGLAAIVIKPTLIGGLERSLEWIEKARKAGIKAVISSTFESGVGISMLVNLAAGSRQPGLAFGFDTLKWFAEDLLRAPISIENGSLRVGPGIKDESQLNMKFLSEVA
jgi:O-succinylbenzoate synthase